MQKALIIVHVIISLALIIVVLMQHGKQQGLSGAIAGGAETFFGKNKGRTVDAMLKKFTSVIAALFIISSVTLAFVSVNENKSKSQNAADSAQTQTSGAAQNATVKLDDNGNLVDENGNVVMTAEQMKEQEQKSGEASADENKSEKNDAEKKDDNAADKKSE